MLYVWYVTLIWRYIEHIILHYAKEGLIKYNKKIKIIYT